MIYNLIFSLLSISILGSCDQAAKKSETKAESTQVVDYNIHNKSNEVTAIDTAEISSLIRRADAFLKQPENVRVFVKRKDKVELEEILDFSNWGKQIEEVYNVVFDEKKPILLIEIPQSGSSDWRAEMRFYFDLNSSTIATKFTESYFNSVCTENAIHREVIKYYDAEMSVIHHIINQRDSKGKAVKDCISDVDLQFDLLENFYESEVSAYLN